MSELNEGSIQFIANLIAQRAQQAQGQADELSDLASQFLNAASVEITPAESDGDGAEE